MYPDDARDPAGGSDPEAGEGKPDAAPEDDQPISPGAPTPPPEFIKEVDEPEETPAEERPPSRSTAEREVKVLNVYQYPHDERQDLTFVLLQDGRGRKLPIFIGQPEALAIVIGLQKEQHDFHRPLTHDLLKNVVEKLGGKIDRLTIDDIWQDTFYARLVVAVGDHWIDVDCRPSDGIAVALRAQVPIYVSEQVLEDCHYREE